VAFTGAFLAWALVDRRVLALRAGLEAVSVGLLATAVGAVIARRDFDGPQSSRLAYGLGLGALLGLLLAVQVVARRPTAREPT
jgi:hypothetical protein